MGFVDGSAGSDTSVEYLLAQATSRDFLGRLPKHQIEALQQAVSRERARRFKRQKRPKYGNINKGFTEDELQRFLACCLNPKANFAFRLMAFLGLRIGEAVRVQIHDVDFNRRKLYVQTEKAGTGDQLHLHDEIYPIIRNWIDAYQDDIMEHDGYLLFSEVSWNKEEHVSENWLRNAFRQACQLAGLDDTYGKSEESIEGRSMRRLHRLTTHSLRHYFITRVYKNTKDPVVAQKLARHTNMKSTQTYIHTVQKDLDISMDKTFEVSDIQKRMEEAEMKKLVQLWRLVR